VTCEQIVAHPNVVTLQAVSISGISPSITAVRWAARFFYTLQLVRPI